LCVLKKQGNKARTNYRFQSSKSVFNPASWFSIEQVGFKLDTSKGVESSKKKNLRNFKLYSFLNRTTHPQTVFSYPFSLLHTCLFLFVGTYLFFFPKKKIQFRRKGPKKKKKNWLIQFMSWKLFWGVGSRSHSKWWL
jgi:hypothetical protein